MKEKVWVVYGIHKEGEIIAPQLFKTELAAMNEAHRIEEDNNGKVAMYVDLMKIQE